MRHRWRRRLGCLRLWSNKSHRHTSHHQQHRLRLSICLRNRQKSKMSLNSNHNRIKNYSAASGLPDQYPQRKLRILQLLSPPSLFQKTCKSYSNVSWVLLIRIPSCQLPRGQLARWKLLSSNNWKMVKWTSDLTRKWQLKRLSRIMSHSSKIWR